MNKAFLMPCILLAGLGTGAARAADEFDRIAPDMPPARTVEPTLPEPAVKTSNDDSVLVARLNGLIILPSLNAVDAAGQSYNGLDTTRLPEEHPHLAETLEPFLGEPVTLARLDGISAAIVEAYRASGRPLVDVLIPEQDITSGTVQIVVLEFRLGKVCAEGNEYTDTSRLTAEIRSEPGQPIDTGALFDDIRWLNRNPFRQVRLVLERGDEFAETDIILQSEEIRPWRVYAGVDNSGSRSTGWERYFAGVNLGDLFELGHVLAYQMTASEDLFTDGALPHGLASDDPRYFAHSFSYLAPLPWRHELSFFGYYSEANPDFGTPFTSTGKSWQVSGRYNIPLSAHRGIAHEIVFGVDFKRTNNDLAFGGTAVSSSSTDVVQAMFAWSGDRADKGGVTAGKIEFFGSPGDLSAFNSDADYQPSTSSVGRLGASAEYVYSRAELVRDQRLIGGFWGKGRLAGQFSSTNLLPSEQFSLGGARSIRGFRESEVLGDHGYLTSLELHAPPLALLSSEGVKDALDIYAFFDRGEAFLKRPAAGESRSRILASAGIGLSYSLGQHLSVQASYGKQIVGSAINTEDNKIGIFRLVLSY